MSNSDFQCVSINNMCEQLSQFEHNKFWSNAHLQEKIKLFGKIFEGKWKE